MKNIYIYFLGDLFPMGGVVGEGDPKADPKVGRESADRTRGVAVSALTGAANPAAKKEPAQGISL